MGVRGKGATNDPRLVLRGQQAVRSACGFYHTLTLTDAGQLYSYGWGAYGQLGHGNEKDQKVPRLIAALKLKPVAQMSCGYYHSACCTDDGMLYTWGCGEDGQLGHGDVLNSIVPRMVKALRDKITVQIQCGYYHTLAIPDTWELYTWGWGENGRLGHGNTKSALKPKRVEALVRAKARVVAAAGGLGHSACITADGGLHVWGWDIYGQLGLREPGSSYGDRDYATPKLVKKLSGRPALRVDCGAGHTVCICQKDKNKSRTTRLYSWGFNGHGQLGLGDRVDRCSPCLVEVHLLPPPCTP